MCSYQEQKDFVFATRFKRIKKPCVDCSADENTTVNNETDWLLGIKRGEATVEQILLSIQSAQDKVLSLRSSLKKAMAKKSKGAILKVNTHMNGAQSSSCSPGKGKVLERSPRDMSDCDMDDAAMPESALSSYGEANDMDIFESTMSLLSVEVPHQMGEFHQVRLYTSFISHHDKL